MTLQLQPGELLELATEIQRRVGPAGCIDIGHCQPLNIRDSNGNIVGRVDLGFADIHWLNQDATP